MQTQKHFVIFSHGFGVRKDARGLFSDIVASLKDIDSVLFDYNDVDEVSNTITLRPLSVQANILKGKIQWIKDSYPDHIIDIVCHSQGAVVAGLVRPIGIRKTIFLAPPTNMNNDRALVRFGSRPGSDINMGRVSKLVRQDGSITLVPPEYWSEKEKIYPIELYNNLATQTKLLIIKAAGDDVLDEGGFEKLNPAIEVVSLTGDHNFTGISRDALVIKVRDLLV